MYKLDYLNESSFRKLERSLKKYNMLAFKKLAFDIIPSLKEGNFLGTLVKTDSQSNIEYYELELPTDQMFKIAHGPIVLHYSVYKNELTILLESISPEEFLKEGHSKELTTYKGVMVSKDTASDDIFKINLLNMLNKD